ncbi:MAG: hypothetical protein N0E50_02690 [Candidatus Thiodiazotropha taylori]|nr:hypothetical protein [Candidatus Thiodiazotropha taylori]
MRWAERLAAAIPDWWDGHVLEPWAWMAIESWCLRMPSESMVLSRMAETKQSFPHRPSTAEAMDFDLY